MRGNDNPFVTEVAALATGAVAATPAAPKFVAAVAAAAVDATFGAAWKPRYSLNSAGTF